MKPTKSKTGGSYELFDLTNDEDDHPLPQQNKYEVGKSAKRADVIDLVEKVPKSRAVSLPAVPTVPIASPAPVTSSISNTSSIEKTSSWLDRFVISKRTYIDPSETVPDIEVSNDDYLREFSTSFVTDTDSNKLVSTVDDLEVEMELDPLPMTDLSVLDLLAKDEAEDNQPSTATINLYNLPYSCTAEEVSLFVEQSGGNIKTIEMGSEDNKKKHLKAGSASVLVEDTSVKDILATINKRKINGRLIRAQRVGGQAQDARRRSSLGKDNGRYFVGDDISFKCNSCGQVGHKVADCTNDPLPIPCHLCAGCDHEPAECPNIICYRCGSFGHHSRDCRSSGGGPRAVICFQCGANDHAYLLCPEFLGVRAVREYDSLVIGPQVQCIDCRKNGHVTCRPTTVKAASSSSSEGEGVVYCYNCGEEGHHVDFPSLSTKDDDEDGANSSRRHHHSSERKANKKGKNNKKNANVRTGVCLAPRCEAFFRYPQLQKDYEFLEDDEKEDYYQSLIRHYNDRALFPVLQAPPTVSRNNNKQQKKRYRDENDDDEYDDYYEREDDDNDRRWSRHDNNRDSHHDKKRRHSDSNTFHSTSNGGGGQFKQMNNNATSSSTNHRRFSDGSNGGSSSGHQREREVETDRNWKKFQETQQQQRGGGPRNDDDFEQKKKQRQDRFRNDRN